jgi:hypothetical protein
MGKSICVVCGDSFTKDGLIATVLIVVNPYVDIREPLVLCKKCSNLSISEIITMIQERMNLD